MKKIIREAPCTFLLAAANVIVFFYLSFHGQTEDGLFMYQHGAMYVPAVIQGHQYYRLFTSMFLHFGFEHLANNMVSLLIFGITLEREIGKVKYIIIYLVSGLGANLLSMGYDIMRGQQSISAGASGAIFGLIGAVLYVAIRNKGRIGTISGRSAIFVIVFTFYYGLTTAGVDNMAHLGGLIVGFILAVLLYWKRRKRYTDDGYYHQY